MRAMDAASRAPDADPLAFLKKTFELLGMGKVATSAQEARSFGFLRDVDSISMNGDRLIADAKQEVLDLDALGYVQPVPRTDIPAPGESVLATLKLAVWTLREGQYISDHDAKVANWAAYTLCGGKVTPGTLVSEQYLLDLERESFLSLCGEKKTQERIAFTLKTGKPLRN